MKILDAVPLTAFYNNDVPNILLASNLSSPAYRLTLCITSIHPSAKANKGRAANAGNIDTVLPLTPMLFLSEYGTSRINIFPLTAAWRLVGCMVTDG